MASLILFDIDLTLIRTNGAGRAAMDAAFFDLFGRANATSGILFDGRTDRGIFMEIIERNGLTGQHAETAYERAIAAYLQRFPASLREKGGEILPGVEAVLDGLAARGVRPGLATGNIARGAEHKLAHFGLWTRFAAGGFGDATPIRAGIVREGMANLAAATGVTHRGDNCVVLGDTPLDIEAAHAAGARAVGVATGRFSVAELTAAGADWALPDLSDTATVLGILLG